MTAWFQDEFLKLRRFPVDAPRESRYNVDTVMTGKSRRIRRNREGRSPAESRPGARTPKCIRERARDERAGRARYSADSAKCRAF